MLPFLKQSQEASASSPIETITRDHDDGEFDEMEMAAEDLCDAVHAKDYKRVAEALKAAFEICDSQPHDEGPHE